MIDSDLLEIRVSGTIASALEHACCDALAPERSVWLFAGRPEKFLPGETYRLEIEWPDVVCLSEYLRANPLRKYYGSLARAELMVWLDDLFHETSRRSIVDFTLVRGFERTKSEAALERNHGLLARARGIDRIGQS